MDILFLASRFPYPPLKGDQVRGYHHVRLLGERHRITLVSFVSGKLPAGAYEHMRPFCARIVQIPWCRSQAGTALLRGLISPLPLQVMLYQHAAMRRAISQVLSSQRFDVAHVQLARMAPYLTRSAGIPRVIDLIDALSLNMERRYRRDCGPLRFPAYVEWKRLQTYEQSICRSFDAVTVVSKTDRTAIGDYANLHIVPNGVDVAQFPLGPSGRQTHSIVFSGNMGYFPNIHAVTWFVQQVLPLIKSKVPDVRFVIVGTNPAPSIRDLARRDPSITVTGYVENIHTYIAQATLAVVPMQAGSGMQNKLIEAMASGTPTVATSHALSGLDPVVRDSVLVGDHPHEFAEQTIALLRDPALRHKLAQSGRRLVEDRYTWEQSVAALDRLYEEAKHATSISQ